MTTSDGVDLDKTRRGALKAVREGRVTIRAVAYGEGPAAVLAAGVVRGFTGLHSVSFMDDRWRCTCGVDIGCSHVLAVQLVTGHASAPLLARATHPATPAAPATVPGECRHGITAAWCADCTGRDGGLAELEQEHARLLTLRGWTTAAYGGRCAACGERYDKGEPIRAVPRADQQPGTVWAGPCCGEQAP